MKHIYLPLALFAFLCSLEGLCQEPSVISRENISIPPSPNAASLGQYGDIPVGLYTGTAQVGIPLYNINEKGMSVPLSLSYHASGIKVEQQASWVGLGWSLNAGGVISRTVRGIPDEIGEGYLKWAESLNKKIDPVNNPADFTYLKRLSEGVYDGEPDFFYYNFSGYSGKLMWTKHQGKIVAKTIPASDLKVTYIVSTQNWKITANDGTQYFFEEKEQGTSGGDNSPSYIYNSAWYLTKIRNANATDSIVFTYKPDKKLTNPTNGFYTQKIRNLLPCGHPEIEANYNVVTQHEQATDTDTKLLSAIRTPTTLVTLHTEDDRPDITLAQRLRQIEVRDVNGKIIKQFDFRYRTDVTQRLFLDQVIEKAPSVEKRHTFAYDMSHGIPPITSKAIDHWGYYNGKKNNQHLIPTFSACSPLRRIFDLKGRQNADRNTDVDYLSMGMLTSITYPTGGMTTFEYEPHMYSNIADHLALNPNGGEYYNTDKYSTKIEFVHGEISPSAVDREATKEFHVNKKQCLSFSFSIDYAYAKDIRVPEGDGIGGGSSSTYVALYRKESSGNLTELYKMTGDVGNVEGERGFSSDETKSFVLNSGNYVLKAVIAGGDIDGLIIGKAILSANANLVTYPDYLLKNYYAGGLRIKKITSTDSHNSNKKTVKSYNYNYTAEPDKSSGKLTNFPLYHYAQYNPMRLPPPKDLKKPPSSIERCDEAVCPSYLVVTSNSQADGGLGQGVHVVYEQVSVVESEIVQNQDSQRNEVSQNGKQTNEFTYFPNLAFNRFPPKTNMGWKQGHLLHQKTYAHQNNTPISSTSTSYIFDTPDHEFDIEGLKVFKSKWSICTPGDPIQNTFYKYPYKIQSKWMYKDREIVLTNGDANTGSIQTTTDYHYSPIHMQLARQVATASDGSKTKTKTYYPDDVMTKANLPGGVLTDQEYSAIDKLKGKLGSQYRIATPIQIETHKLNPDGTEILLTRQRNLFKEENGLVLPDIIQSSTGVSTLEDKVIYHQYDNKGNPLEVSNTDNLHTVYLWGYSQTLPIAKIENAIYSGIPSGTITKLQALSNDDTDHCRTADCKEQLLRVELDKLRGLDALSNALITTYTYDPLIGMTSQTDPNGVTIYYEYDDFNRLKSIVDQDGNKVQEVNYHYKNQ